MIYTDNDTLNATQQNKNLSQEDKSKNKDAMTAKLLASMATGLVVGAGATYAAGHLNKTTEDIQTEEVNAETASGEGSQIPEDSNTTAQPTVEERIKRLEEKERIREQHEQERQRHETEHQHHEEQRQKNEESRQQKHDDNDDIFKGHDVKIESVETRTLDDGTTVQIYSGTIDGHEAAFMANSNGQVVAAIVDANDNGNIDNNEVIDLRENNVTTQYLAQYQVTPPQTPDITIVAVENDVELGGETVNVAYVTMDDQPVVFIDRNQNGEVDVAIADSNHNGSIDEGEMQDISEAHITMPTADDISGTNMVAGIDDGTEDYSNDADVTLYEV